MDSGFPEGVEADGCLKTCRPNEILIVNVAKNDWECVPESFKLVFHFCIFYTGAQGNLLIQCSSDLASCCKATF